MIVPDVNMLLYAEVDAYPHHRVARRWWEGALNGETPIGLPAAALFGFLRISTNRRIFAEPLHVDAAIGRVNAWLDRGHVALLTPGSRYLEIAFRLLRSLGTGSNLTTDVQIAAHAIEHNAEVHSNDNDFARFEGVRWINPLARKR